MNQPICRPRFFLKDFFPFFWEFFSGPVVGAFPQARVSKMIVVSPQAGHLQVLTFFPSFLSCCLLSFPSLPSFLPSFLSSFLHHISKARIANSHKSKKQQKPTEAFESQHKSPKANRSQQKPTEASNSYQKPLKATRSQQKPPEATKIPQKPTKATKSE